LSIDSTVITVAFLLLIVYYVHICIRAVMVKNPVASGEPDTLRFIFMVPCRNEEKVIGTTIRRILEIDYPLKEILVINDGSTDKTEVVVKGFADTGIVEVVNTVDSGRGKGEALNFGFRHILNMLREEGVSNFEGIMIGILDADGQPSENLCAAVEPYFTDEQVGALQAGVRIANADSNLIATCQDVEFTGFSQAIQKGRDKLGSVGLGGNGQFARLSALCSLSLEHPWNQSLTEDLDIGMRLILRGWKVRFCSGAFVAQQGVESVPPLVIQRVRWMQGHYGCWRYIPSLLINRNLPLKTRLDNTAYLLFGATPILVLVSMITSLVAAAGVVSVSNRFAELLLNANFFLFIFMFYFMSFIIAIVFVTFYVRYRKMSLLRLIILYHLFALYTLLWIPASIGAIVNLIRGKSTWVKTGRTEIEDFREVRGYKRVDIDIPMEVEGGGDVVKVIVKDVAAGGAGILVTKKYYLENARGLISTGNKVDVITPVTGERVSSEVVWVAYLGRGQVRAGVQFVESTVDVKRDFGFEDPYPYQRSA